MSWTPCTACKLSKAVRCTASNLLGATTCQSTGRGKKINYNIRPGLGQQTDVISARHRGEKKLPCSIEGRNDVHDTIN